MTHADPTPEENPSDEHIVQMSGNRAKVMAFLKKHPGHKYSRRQVGEATGVHVSQVGDFLQGFVDAGFIKTEGNRVSKRVWYEGSTVPAVVTPDDPPAGKPTGRTVRTQRPVGTEVVLPDGVTVIVGRNPHTGRLRVEFGE